MFPAIGIPEALLRMSLAVILGSTIGLDRERGESSAGLRTHALVSLAASVFMLVSAFGISDIKSAAGISFNPTQVAAQVVSGIGFLGAGAILLRREVVRGMTTAAALWFATAIGLACGAGMFAVAAIATAFALLLLVVLKPLERRLFPRRFQQIVRVKLAESEGVIDLLSLVTRESQTRDIQIADMAVRQRGNNEVVIIRWRSTSESAVAEVLDILRAQPAVTSVQATLSSA